MKKMMIGINALLIVGLCVSNYDYLGAKEFATKAFCSGLFAALGALNAAYVLVRGGKRLFAVIMAAGLVLAMQADIAIGKSFVKGAGLFAAGHLCFFSAGCMLRKPCRKDGLWILALAATSAAYLLLDAKLVFWPSALRWVCVGYVAVISLMTGKAIANFVHERGWITGLMMAGSVLFFASDLMLLLDMFRRGGRIFGILCISLYYPAEMLLAHSVFYSARK